MSQTRRVQRRRHGKSATVGGSFWRAASDFPRKLSEVDACPRRFIRLDLKRRSLEKAAIKKSAIGGMRHGFVWFSIWNVNL